MNRSEAFKLFTVQVTAAGTFGGSKIEIDNNYEKLTGLYLVKQPLTNYPTVDFMHDGVADIIEKDFPAEFFMSSDDLSPNNRFLKLDLIGQKKPMTLTVKDPGGNTYPYTLKFIYRLENPVKNA